jgi:predicted transcriptional regulator
VILFEDSAEGREVVVRNLVGLEDVPEGSSPAMHAPEATRTALEPLLEQVGAASPPTAAPTTTPAVRVANAKEAPPPSVDAEDIAIIRVLGDDRNRYVRLSHKEIARQTRQPHIGVRTVDRRMPDLVSDGLVITPRGKKKGYVITPLGRDLLKNLPQSMP